MLNQVVLVGRLTHEPTIEITVEGQKRTIITLAIPRSYKNDEGMYETDFIPCLLWKGIAENTCEYCKKGDIMGVRGRLERLANKELCVIADKVTFISSRKESEEE